MRVREALTRRRLFIVAASIVVLAVCAYGGYRYAVQLIIDTHLRMP